MDPPHPRDPDDMDATPNPSIIPPTPRRSGRHGGIAVYVTSHGFGHLNRSVSVVNRIPNHIPVTIKCHSDLFRRWRERLTREVTLSPGLFDAGAVNPEGDSSRTDGPASLQRAWIVHSDAMSRLDEEIQWLSDHRFATVLCDAPAPPLAAARRAGLEAFLLTNFTWADIYAPYASRAGEREQEFVHQLRSVYKSATLLLRSQPSMAMSWKRERQDVGLVVDPGRNRRVELRDSLGLSHRERLVAFYVGRYGQRDLAWERLESLEKQGIHFLSLHSPGETPMRNFHVLPAEEWTGADLAATSHAVLAKAGYGTVSEVMSTRRPLIYPPRHGFAEHRILDRALRDWGGGVPISNREFRSLSVRSALQRALTLRPIPPPFPTDGAATVARILTEACRRSD
jgi:hypothetical protein